MKIDKTISTFTHKLDPSVEREIVALFKKYNNVRRYVFSRYSSITQIANVFDHKKQIRDKWTADGTLDSFGIPLRYARMALDDCIGNIKNRWNQAIKNARKKITSNESLSNDERHYILYMLRSRKLLIEILCGREIDIPAKFIGKDLDLSKLHRKICRVIRRSLPKISKPWSLSSMMIDQEMWSLDGDVFCLAATTKYKRWKLPLTSPIKLNGNLRICYDRHKSRLKVSNCIEVSVKPSKDNVNVIGIDKNYVNAIDSSTGGHYGVGFNKAQDKATNVLSAKDKARKQYSDKARELKSQGKTNKAQRIVKNNLGKKKYDKKKNALNEECRKITNMAIKDMIATEKPAVVGVEQLNFTSRGKKKYNKKVKNKLNRFQKGVLQDRLTYHLALNGIEMKEVNAAYSSQTCDQCGSSDGKRIGDMFHCTSCGRGEHSGQVAATIIKSRIDDDEITLDMSPRQVKSVLIERFKNRSECQRLSESQGEFQPSEPSQPRPPLPASEWSELPKNPPNSTCKSRKS